MSEETTKKYSKKKYYDNVNVGKRTKQVVYFVEQNDKADMYVHLIKNSDKKQSVVVVKSKRRADELSAYLNANEIKTTAIHGNHRVQLIEESVIAFNNGEINILITTDKILQSLELSGIERIINYDIPPEHEDYFSRLILVDEVGDSISFVAPDDEGYLAVIEMRLKNEIPHEDLKGFIPTADKVAHIKREKKKKPRHRNNKSKKTSKSGNKKEEQ